MNMKHKKACSIFKPIVRLAQRMRTLARHYDSAKAGAMLSPATLSGTNHLQLQPFLS